MSYSSTPRETISTCPVCEGDLRVTRLQCATCGTAIEGQFTVSRFSRLSREQTALLESFLRARGNLRELERELGISYPTVRGRVEALLRALDLADGETLVDGDPASTDEPAAREPAPSEAVVDPALRREVLERLARREISAEEAAAQLSAGAGPDQEASE